MYLINLSSVILSLYLMVLSIQFSIARRHTPGVWQPPKSSEVTFPAHRIPYKPFTQPTGRSHSFDRNDPCASYNPLVPDFSAPGRRISDVKCYEYIWQVKVRHDREKEIAKCRANGRPMVGVVGGRLTKRGEFPNMGAIGWKLVVGKWRFMCGSTLISPNFVLTAAHCSQASIRDTTLADTVPKIVRLGSRNILDQERVSISALDVRIIKVIVHPNYKSPKQYFDIALMELAQEVSFSTKIQPSCLWTKQGTTFPNKPQVTGWGAVKSGSLQTSPDLLTAEVEIIDSVTCDGLLRPSCNRNWCGLQEHQICAGNLSGGVDACEGDSGGPLQVKINLPIGDQGNMNYVIGVTSFGIRCGLPGLPGVHIRVASFLDWIESIVWPVAQQIKKS